MQANLWLLVKLPTQWRAERNVLSLKAGRSKSEREKAEFSIHPNSLMKEITASPRGGKMDKWRQCYSLSAFEFVLLLLNFPRVGI